MEQAEVLKVQERVLQEELIVAEQVPAAVKQVQAEVSRLFALLLRIGYLWLPAG
jgi:hypothetical protein